MRNFLILNVCLVALLTAAPVNGQITTPQRNVQFRTIDLSNSVAELRNFGSTDQNLTGWRFCTHDEGEVRQYSATGGLSGRILAAGESLFVHFNNDADAAAADQINVSSIGGSFAQPLDANGAYGIQIYFQTPFGVGANIADHLQFSEFGLDDTSADDRSDEAQIGGVWVDQNDWIAVLPETEMIVFDESTSDSELSDSSNYENVFSFIQGDIDANGAVNLLDVQPFVDLLSNGVYNPAADFNLDGTVNLLDISSFVDVLSGG